MPINRDAGTTFYEVAANMTKTAESGYIKDVLAAVDLLCEVFSAGRKLLVFGNGGSSADAQHLSAELVGRFFLERAPLPAIALTTNQAVLTAWGNDYSFEDVFARQVDALGVSGDVALGISTSGKSRNVLAALRRARDRGLRTIGLCGANITEMRPLCDVIMRVPLTETARIQEVHLVTYHVMCAEIEARLFGDQSVVS